jgi:fatty-acyl-CoA synthase
VPGSNFAAVWDAVARTAPDRTAMAAADRRVSWGEFADRAHHLAWCLRHDASLAPGDRVAIALGNRPEYLEAFYAALAIRCVPVNVDPLATSDVLHSVLDDSDAKVLLHTAETARAMRTAAKRIPKPWRPRLLEVGEPYEHALAAATPPGDSASITPDGSDLVFLYTSAAGGGRATAVMWRNDDLYRGLVGKHTGTVLPLAPLAHSTGLFSAIAALAGAGTVVLLDPRADASLVWSTVERERVGTLVVVGDPGARPLLAALETGARAWDLSALGAITSSGQAFSSEVRRRLLTHLPHVAIADSLRAADGSDALCVSEHVAVFGEETMQPVLPGSGEAGLLAMTGLMPVGYWKDPARTAATFRVVDGTRYVMRGEYATVDADGKVHLIGRGNASINADGTKVDPHDVEQRLAKHASIEDCAVVGVPDVRGGEMVVALVVVVENHYLDEAELVAWCRTKLGKHEAPQRFLFVDTVHRAASGAVNRPRLRELAMEILEGG